MQVPASIKSLPWRAVVGLLLAGLLGWLAAWLVIPAGPAPGAAGKEASPLARPSASPPGQIAPDGAIGARPEGSAPRASLEQLLQRQDKLSEGAARSSAALPAQPAGRQRAAGVEVAQRV
ncbi:MAG: hypothetical protein ACOYNZ_12640, partial [Rhodoferax sp.]